MSHRPLGMSISFRAMNTQLDKAKGEILVAHWLRDPINTPEVAVIEDERRFDSIVAKARHGYYNELKFFATTNFTENPFAYSETQSDETVESAAANIENLVTKALEARVITAHAANEMRACASFRDAIALFLEKAIYGPPEEWLSEWGISMK